ncbi:amidohydrolase/deacetylase family metallohydrolase [Nonomuraea sp. SYSU D8015]|uniref:amidohydrolase/deacetylase family metallohydrolase n=1 Tax=Nonomuraea sp. SYSU D8015 TaxID=2593644 RepID=UPI001660B36A|nr:amidohydrolase/deacetylase family metallohydrolase [Nonomuraea sp. SYSU D8015]
MSYDLLLAGGEVIDVGGGHVGRFDVGVRGGRIAAVAPGLPRHTAREVIDARGKLITPGLVDLHTHVHPGATYWGIDPDAVAWYSGVTTWVDAGSAGAYAIDSLRAAIGDVRVRVAALLNISAVGLTAPDGESRELANCDVDLAAATLAANRDMIFGVKVRMDGKTVGDNGLEPLRRAIAVAETGGVPVMVHIGVAPPAVDEVLGLLRPGDIVTHCASGLASGMVDGTTVTPAVIEAHTAGVLFDIGHGSGGFAFDVLEAQLKAGVTPHTISSDLHARSLYGPVFDLPTTMTKLLAAGLPLHDVVAAATVRPARALNLPGGIGTLAVGARADLAVFTLQEGEFELVDAHRRCRVADRRLVNEVTYIAGRPLPPRLPPHPKPWIPLTGAQHEALRLRDRRVRELLSAPLVGLDGLAEQFPRSAADPA